MSYASYASHSYQYHMSRTIRVICQPWKRRGREGGKHAWCAQMECIAQSSSMAGRGAPCVSEMVLLNLEMRNAIANQVRRGACGRA